MPQSVPPQTGSLLLLPPALAEAAPSAPCNISPCLHHTAFLIMFQEQPETVTLGYFHCVLAAEGVFMHSKFQLTCI